MKYTDRKYRRVHVFFALALIACAITITFPMFVIFQPVPLWHKLVLLAFLYPAWRTCLLCRSYE